ncbi:MAG: hypothetical protein JOY93_04470 [Acidobacteriales bacterium]|nr:hypothetical protein [Terriglobales bacterium]
MTIAVLLVLMACLTLALVLWLAKGSVPKLLSTNISEDSNNCLRSVDIQAFRNLIDPAEEAFLRSNLPSAEFRMVQRERMWAAIAYVSCAAYNASILMKVGESARDNPNLEVAEAGRALVDDAIRLRLYALHAMAQLYLAVALPGLVVCPLGVPDRYEKMTGLVIRLRSLQYPVRSVVAAL